MASLSAEEALKVSESFLVTLYTYEVYERWARLKKRLNFSCEKDFVVWMINCIETHGFDQMGPVVPVGGGTAGSRGSEYGAAGSASDVLQHTIFGSQHHVQREAAAGSVHGGTPDQQLYMPIMGAAVAAAAASGGDISAAASKKLPFPYSAAAAMTSQVMGGPAAAFAMINTSGHGAAAGAAGSNNAPAFGPSGEDAYLQMGLGLVPNMDVSNDDAEDMDLQAAAASSESIVYKTQRGDPNPLKQQRFICVHCNQRFRYKHVMQRHVAALHLNIKKFACSQCESVFVREDHLNAHVSSVHDHLKPYSCEICGRAFGQQSGLDGHMRFVHENYRRERQELCEHCAYKCVSQSDLNRHCIAKHGYQSQYQCDVCLKYFAQMGKLKRHSCKVLKRKRKAEAAGESDKPLNDNSEHSKDAADDDSTNDSPVKAPSRKTGRKGRKKAQAKRIFISSDESDDDQEEEVETKAEESDNDNEAETKTEECG